MSQPVDLKTLFGSRYRVTLDEAVPRKTKDPWYFQIPCQYGHFYPHSSELIGFFCTGPLIMKRLHRGHPELKLTECDGEGIFCFRPDQFEMVAKYAKPKKRRRLSPEHRQKAIAALDRFRAKSRQMAGKTAQISTIAGRLV